MAYKEITKKDYQERVNKILTYIHNNLDKEVKLNDLANIASFSTFHIHRIFSAYVGESLRSYIRRCILLRSASFMRRFPFSSVSDIAMDAHYDTPAAFTRAFKQYFSQSPTEFKKSSFSVQDLEQKFNKKEIIKIEPEVVLIDPFRILYVQEKGPYDISSRKAWEKIFAFEDANNLENCILERIGVGYDDPETTEPEDIRYDACLKLCRNVVAEGEIKERIVDGEKYVKAFHKGAYYESEKVYASLFRWIVEKWN